MQEGAGSLTEAFGGLWSRSRQPVREHLVTRSDYSFVKQSQPKGPERATISEQEYNLCLIGHLEIKTADSCTTANERLSVHVQSHNV